MKLTTVAEALSANEDEPVLAIRGTLTKLFDPLTGDNQYGPWSIQNAMLKDETGEIKVAFSNRDPVPKMWRGKVIELRCSKGQKGGYSGVKATIDKRDKKTQLTVSDKGEVFLFNQEHQPEATEGVPAGAGGPAKAPSKPAEPPLAKALKTEQAQAENAPETARNELASDMAKGRDLLYRIANYQYAGVSMVREYLKPLLEQRGIEIDPIQEAALVQNMLIQGYREDIHKKFPPKMLPVFVRQQTPKPTEPPPPNGS